MRGNKSVVSVYCAAETQVKSLLLSTTSKQNKPTKCHEKHVFTTILIN